MSIGRHTAIHNFILVAKFVGKHQSCFPIFFIPKKDIAVREGVPIERMRTQVVTPFIIFSN